MSFLRTRNVFADGCRGVPTSIPKLAQIQFGEDDAVWKVISLRFPARLSPRRRRIYRFLVGYFVVIFLGMIWPVYPLFDSIRPFVLGVPFALFYLVILLSATFAALLTVYLWESKNDEMD